LTDEDHKKIEAINKFCIEQMKISSSQEDADPEDEYHQGIWIICSKIHGYIIRGPEDIMNNLRLIGEKKPEKP